MDRFSLADELDSIRLTLTDLASRIRDDGTEDEEILVLEEGDIVLTNGGTIAEVLEVRGSGEIVAAVCRLLEEEV